MLSSSSSSWWYLWIQHPLPGGDPEAEVAEGSLGEVHHGQGQGWCYQAGGATVALQAVPHCLRDLQDPGGQGDHDMGGLRLSKPSDVLLSMVSTCNRMSMLFLYWSFKQ